MREVFPELLHRWESGRTIGVCMVVATLRSAPQRWGMAILAVWC